MNSAASWHGDPFDGPVTVDLLADLQAGLLDDQTAAGLRRRARTDPGVARDLARLDRIRRDVTHLGVDADSAAEIPADVAARVGAALSNQPRLPGRGGGRRASVGRAPLVRFRRAAAAIGLVAVVAAGAVGTTMLLRNDSARAPGGVPLSDAQILHVLTHPPDLGVLATPQRRASCLSGLGYPSTTLVLGARPLDVRGRPGVLLLLPGDVPDLIDAIVVTTTCSAADTGLLAASVVRHT